MTNPNVLKALEGLECAVDALHDITCDLIDFRDARNERVAKSLIKARDALSALRDEVEGGVDSGSPVR